MPKKLTITLEAEMYDGLHSVIGRLYPTETEVKVAGERRKTMADQITIIAKQQSLRPLGSL